MRKYWQMPRRRTSQCEEHCCVFQHRPRDYDCEVIGRFHDYSDAIALARAGVPAEEEEEVKDSADFAEPAKEVEDWDKWKELSVDSNHL